MTERTSLDMDWPNAQGFDVTYEEREPVELEVTGRIPAFAAGTLYRTGAGPLSVDTDVGTTYRVHHWFDNLAINHRFQIIPTENGQSCRVIYNSRSSCDGLIEKIKKTGDRSGVTFGAKYDICKTLFRKVQSVFRPGISKNLSSYRPNEVSTAVTMTANFPGLSKTAKALRSPSEKSDGIYSICNKTDANMIQMLDPETLEPIGLASQARLHPDLTGPLSSAHAEYDPVTGDAFNYNLDFVQGKGLYRIFTVSAFTGQTSILASFSSDPTYIHSMFLTENYFILCVWNGTYAYSGLSLMWKQNIIDSLSPYDPNKPTRWYVVDRVPPESGGQGLITTFESEAFFCLHTINAYEEASIGDDGKIKTDIIADLAAYDNLDILKRFYLENLMSDSPAAKSLATMKDESYRPSTWRFRLPNIPSVPIKSKTRPKAEVIFKTSKNKGLDLPTLNPNFATKKHRYVYGVANTNKSTFMDSLVKFDCQNHTRMMWSAFGQTAGEAIFISNPDAADDDEDNGVLLSVVLDGTSGKSYLLVLDAKTMTEVGRASLNGPIGFGFHGTHIPQRKDSEKKLSTVA